MLTNVQASNTHTYEMVGIVTGGNKLNVGSTQHLSSPTSTSLQLSLPLPTSLSENEKQQQLRKRRDTFHENLDHRRRYFRHKLIVYLCSILTSICLILWIYTLNPMPSSIGKNTDFHWHPIIMSITVLILIPPIVIFNNLSFWIHALFGSISFIFLNMGIITALALRTRDKLPSLYSLHAVLGFIVLFLMKTNIFSGVSLWFFNTWTLSKWSRNSHCWYFAITIMVVLYTNVVLGICQMQMAIANEIGPYSIHTLIATPIAIAVGILSALFVYIMVLNRRKRQEYDDKREDHNHNNHNNFKRIANGVADKENEEEKDKSKNISSKVHLNVEHRDDPSKNGLKNIQVIERDTRELSSGSESV